MKPYSSMAVMAILCGLSLAAVAEGNATRGQMLYQSMCMACHSIDYNGVGPAHKGLLGRKAGSAMNYDYSPALRAASVVWTATTLDRWLADPEKLIPGQKMGFSVASAQDRADLISYLSIATGAK